MNSEYRERSIIGCIYFDDFDNIVEERRVDNTRLPKLGEVSVEVFDNEGDYIPHCHIFNKDKSFDCCICLDRPVYFKHGNHKSEMNSKQLKKFNEFMLKNNKRALRILDKRLSNWEYAVLMWMGSNSNDDLPKKQPDYTKTKDSIHA